MLILLLIVAISLTVASRQQTIGRFLRGQLVDPNLDQYNRSTLFHGDPTAVSPWARAPVLHRLAVRYAVIVLPVLFIISYITHPIITAALLLTAAALVTAWLIWQTWQWATTRQLRKMKAALFDGLKQTVGWSDVEKPGNVILAGSDYQTSGVTLLPPSTFQRLDIPIEHTETIASRTLGGEWEADWNLVGQPTVQLHHAPPPPDEVTWNEIEHYLYDPSQLVLGLGSRSKAITLDLESETPHIMLSVPTGGGKSVAVALLACQVLHNGGQLVLIDLKRDTHWIKQEPGTDELISGVTYCKTPEEAHAKLVELGALMELRYQTKDADPNYSPHRILIVAEELNMTADLLNSYWSDLKQRGTSPALKTLRSLMYAGRACRMHVLAITQYGTAQAFGTGGGAARENAARILGGNSSDNAWELLAPQITQRPEKTNHRGRMHIIDGDNYRTVQVGYLTDEQARGWATTGAEPVPAMAGEEELPGWLQ